MYSILRSRAVNFSFSVASLERQDISGERRLMFRINVTPNTHKHMHPHTAHNTHTLCWRGGTVHHAKCTWELSGRGEKVLRSTVVQMLLNILLRIKGTEEWPLKHVHALIPGTCKYVSYKSINIDDNGRRSGMRWKKEMRFKAWQGLTQLVVAGFERASRRWTKGCKWSLETGNSLSWQPTRKQKS